MKITIDLDDKLLARVKQHAKNTGRPLRAVVEDALCRLLAESESLRTYRMPDMSVGDPRSADPLEAYSWQGLRRVIYGEPAQWRG